MNNSFSGIKSVPSVYLFFLLLFSCGSKAPQKDENTETPPDTDAFLLVLGTLQDGGSPHAGCTKPCCRDLYGHPDPERKIISLGLIDPVTGKTWLFEPSPDLPQQLYELNTAAGRKTIQAPDGIFVTHAHIGHYAGLIYLGKEAMNTSSTTVYAMPRLKTFLETSGPWSQLVSLKNIVIEPLENDRPVSLSSSISVKPLLVPHRDEFSETVGFIIEGPSKKILFIPDIDKWNKWDKSIAGEIGKVDIAFIDGTFYDGREIKNRSIAEIPHPFISETMELFKNLEPAEKNKIHFIHFNHTNPLLNRNSAETKALKDEGYHVAVKGQRIYL